MKGEFGVRGGLWWLTGILSGFYIVLPAKEVPWHGLQESEFGLRVQGLSFRSYRVQGSGFRAR